MSATGLHEFYTKLLCTVSNIVVDTNTSLHRDLPLMRIADNTDQCHRRRHDVISEQLILDHFHGNSE